MESPNDNPIDDAKAKIHALEDARTEEQVVADELVEVEDINEPIVPQLSGVEVAPTDTSADLENEFNPMLFVQLGDRIWIESTQYGRTVGTVYYRSLEQIHVKPDGVSNLLHIFEIEQTDDEEIYNEKHGVTVIYVIEKRKYGSFVELENFKIDQTIDTYSKTENDSIKQYKITDVDKNKDSIVIQNPEDPEEKIDIIFDFIGIPFELDFNIINIRYYTRDTDSNPNVYEQVIESEEKEEYNEKEAPSFEIVGYIEVKEARIFKELPLFKQLIPDSIQKIDALNNFINGVDSNRQKDPNVLRNLRILIETYFYLKQSTIDFNENGSIKGEKEVSANTLRELIQVSHIPLGRPVLNIQKKVYIVDDEDETENIDPSEDVYNKDFNNELVKYNNDAGSHLKSMGYVLSKLMSPWKHILNENVDENRDDIWKAYADSDIYRKVPPHLRKGTFNSIIGYIASGPGSKGEEAVPVLTDIPFGIERALTTTYRKANKADNEHLTEKIKKTIFLNAEKAELNGYLLFPQSVSPYMGTTRSKQLAIDSGRALMQPHLIRDILVKVNDPTSEEGASSNSILFFEADETEDYTISDYIDGLTIHALAMGDTFITLDQYGMENIELNESSIEVIQNKLDEYQSRLIGHLKGMRATLADEQKQEIVPFLENISFMKIIEKDSILSTAIKEYKEYNLSLNDSDVGLINHLMKVYNVYFQIVIGQNSVLYTKANLDISNLNYLNNLRISMLLKERNKTQGLRPRRNICKHVGHFLAVRKIYNNEERFQEMINVFKVYQGRRFNNWIKCNSCSENLMCLHERLQLQAYINPAEKDVIEKEIILKFSGGQFQGSYICRNCGQQIKSIDFENSMEYDDDGKPKSGRAVLVDEDALFEERLDMLIAPSPEKQNEEMVLSDVERLILTIIKEITDKIGIKFDVPAYRRVITNTLEALHNPVIVRSEKSYADARIKNPQIKLAPWPSYIAQYKICITAVFILIEIQCKIPSYNARFVIVDCKSPGFNGYPLIEDLQNRQGIEYLACAISMIRIDSPPWTQTGFMGPKIDAILRAINKTLNSILSHVVKNDMIQYQLSEKRKYIENKNTSETDKKIVFHLREDIPVTFLPQQILITKAEAAESQITEEIVKHMGEKGDVSLVRLWIRQAHILAKETAIIVRGSPLIETTCCVSPATDPHKYWKENVLPTLKGRMSNPKIQAPFIMPSFIPRKAELDVVEPDKEQYYGIFLKYCFQGPRIGHPHEPGLTYHCLWCGFQFPVNPSIMIADTEGKAALQAADIKTDEEPFNELLDKIHNVNQVQPVVVNSISTFESIMEKLARVRPAPIATQSVTDATSSTEEAIEDTNNITREEQNWEKTINLMTENLMKVKKDTTDQDVYAACADIGDLIGAHEDSLRAVLAHTYIQYINSILELPWKNFFQVIQTYFIIPLQRLYSNFNTSLFKVPKEYDLSDDHIKDVSKIFASEIENLSFKSKIAVFRKDTGLYNKLRKNIKYLIDQFVAIMPFKHILNRDYIPGNEVSLNYIKKIIFMGPLYVFIRSFNITFNITDSENKIKIAFSNFYSHILNLLFIKYNNEKLSYDDDKIKLLIAIRDEKERVNVVKQFNDLSDEERAIELMNKRLGLGKWAVGGTKLIYSYDKDYYDLERQKRLDAGIIDFPGSSDGNLNMPEGREHDEMGIAIYTDAEIEAEGGYDNNQHADDDNE